MSGQVERLGDDADPVELREFVRNSNVEELVEMVRNNIYNRDISKRFDNILQAFSDSDACQSKRYVLIESTLKTLGKIKLTSRQVDEIISRIILDLPRYSKQYLVKLVDFCIARIRNDDDAIQSWKDLLPVLLEALENEKYIMRSDTEVSGMEYKSAIIREICNYHWKVDLLPALTKMFGDMALDKANRALVLKGLCHFLSQLSLDQVPPFVHQALKLCKDRDSQYFLDILCNYFHSLHSKIVLTRQDIDVIDRKEIENVQSTVLYHVYQAAQLNHDNMKDFIRYLKTVSSAPEYTLQPFMLSVLLSVSSIYEDQIFDIVRLAIINSSLDKERRQASAWLRPLLPSSSDVISNIRQVIESSNKECHLTLKGLISLAFLLMSTDEKLRNNRIAVCHIGGEIIREVIKKRHKTVTIVLQELIDKIVAGGLPTTHYINCLKYACRELSIIVLDHQVWIMILLERILFLPSTVASQVLLAIFPLMHASSSIRENLLLTLRKALYRKGTSKRQMAVTGFLQMLKYSKAHSLGSFRLSQRCNSSAYAISSRSILTQVSLECSTQREKQPISECNKTLCYEILDILKKSFTYEFQVRLHLYEGFYSAVKKNPEITEIVVDMLISHFNLYLNTDDTILPPVKFELLSEIQGTDIVVQEPIAELIFALQKIYIGTLSRKSNSSDKLHDILESLCRRMAATELDHLHLDQDDGIDLLGDFPKSQIKVENLNTAISIYEALIAYRIGEWWSSSSAKGNVEMSRNMNELFQGFVRFMDFLKMSSLFQTLQCDRMRILLQQQSVKSKKADSGGGKRKRDKDTTNNTTKKSGKLNNIKISSSIMDLDTISQCLSFLFSRVSPSSDEHHTFREDSNFRRYIFETCGQLLQRTSTSAKNSSQLLDEQCIDTCIEIGRLLYEHFLLNLMDAFKQDESIAILALQCFKEICSSICTLFAEKLPRFLNKILRSKNTSLEDKVDLQLQQITLLLGSQLKASLVDDETSDERKNKISLLLIEILEQFIHRMNFERLDSKKMLECSRKLAESENVSSSIVPAIVQLLLHIEECSEEYGDTLNEMCLELCEKLGTIDRAEMSRNDRFKVIREDTAVQVYNTLNSQVKEKLNNACWLLMRLKAEDNIVRMRGAIDEMCSNNLKEKERSLCKQLSYLAQVLHTLANTSIEPGLCTDFTFKNLQCLYHLLGNLTKYFYAKSNGQNPAYQAVKFIQVIQLAGKPLKSAFYNLVTHVEENQNKLTRKSDSHAQRRKILKETKIIPRVVYEIEQFNKEVLLLGKRTGIPLENYMKHSVTRDFRIKNPQLVEDLEKMDVTLLNSSNSEEETINKSCSSNNITDDAASTSQSILD